MSEANPVIQDTDVDAATSFIARLRCQADEHLKRGLVDMPGLNEQVKRNIALLSSGMPILSAVLPKINKSILISYAQHVQQVIDHCIYGDQAKEETDVVSKLDLGESPQDSLMVLVDRILKADGMTINAIGKASDIPIDRLAFFGIYLARPIRSAVRRIVSEEFDFSKWMLGYCPVCGLWPRMARIGEPEGRRYLWCVGCDNMWPFARVRCPFCMENDQDKLAYLTAEKMEGYRIYTCDSCRRFLKARDERQSASVASRPLDVDYLITNALDRAAFSENYIQDFVGFAAFDMGDNEAAKSYRDKALDTPIQSREDNE